MICRELLRDSAPKLSATIQQPRMSCSKPSDSSGLAGSSPAEPRCWDAAPAAGGNSDKGGGRVQKPGGPLEGGGGQPPPRCETVHRARGGGAGGCRSPAQEEATAAADPGGAAMGQQEPGSSIGRDMAPSGDRRPMQTAGKPTVKAMQSAQDPSYTEIRDAECLHSEGEGRPSAATGPRNAMLRREQTPAASAATILLGSPYNLLLLFFCLFLFHSSHHIVCPLFSPVGGLRCLKF